MTARAGGRVLVVHPSDELYGADRMLLHVVDALREHTDASVEVWLPDDLEVGTHVLSGELTARGVTWHHRPIPVLRRSYLRPSGWPVIARRLRWARSALRREAPDLVYLGTSACLPVLPLARMAGVPARVLHMQELWSGAEAVVLRRLAAGATATIAISNAVATANRPRATPTVIENCVAGPAVPPAPLGDDRDGPTYVIASRWTSRKGHRTLLTAWDRAGCRARLVVLGGPPPIGEALDLPALVDELVSRPGTVDVVGEVPDVASHIAGADAVLVPSDAPEGFGLVSIEGYALARPVIASRGGGAVDVVTDGVDGWLFEPGDADELAALFRTLSIEDLRVAGEHGRATWERRFRPEEHRRRIAEVVAAELRRTAE